MANESRKSDESKSGVFERNITDGDSSPKMALLRIIADIEGVDETDLPTLYSCIDEMIEKLYSNPPSPEARAHLEFAYHGYRVTLYQDGMAVLEETQ